MADVSGNLKDWSTTAASNSPSGTTNVSTGLDDNLRELQKVVRQDLAHKGADIASGSTTDLGAVVGLFHDITGVTTITSFGTVSAGIWKVLKFEGILTLTHNATSLILLTGQSRTTAVGDVGIYVSEGSGNWREVAYSGAESIIPLIDTNPLVRGSADSTKKVRLEVDGLTTGTTRVITPPDMDCALVSTIVKRKTADETVASSTTLQDDDHLTFSIAANEEWVANFFISTGTLTPGGIKVAINGPAGATLNLNAEVQSSGGFSISSRTTTLDSEIISITDNPSSSSLWHLSVWILNGANAGSVTFRWAQSVSNVAVTTVHKGSHLVAHRVA